MSALLKTIQECLGAVLLWAGFSLSPLQSIRSLLAHQDTAVAVATAAKIWVVAIILGAVFLMPMLELFGIAWQNTGFFLCGVTITLVGHLIAAYTIHLGLRCGGLRSDLIETALIFTIKVCYIPFASVLGLPAIHSLYRSLSQLKKNNTDLDAAILQLPTVLESIKNKEIVLGLAGSIGGTFNLMLNLVTAAVFIEIVCWWYNNPRAWTYIVVSGAMFAALLITFLVTIPLIMLTVYAYIK